MNIATHNVEVLCPEAFAATKRCLFPCAPRYSRNSVPPEGRDHQAVRRECALLRDLTLVPFPVSWQTRSCFYRWPCASEPVETRLGCQGARTSILEGEAHVKRNTMEPWRAGSPPTAQAVHPRLERAGLSRPLPVIATKQYRAGDKETNTAWGRTSRPISNTLKTVKR